ncbi:hypothetical protein NM688_g1628 [Phlebia brevispora]|uniref:Uncharacterized protein n=1 Tax=Phlebia brevispora TaxID=194682 RepID=A0ACC1TB97_9APHY|nr:hypothetical protein NM688_g1628 [Phlebia brevispora]
MLASLRSFSEHMRNVPGRYLRTLVMYDPSITTIGVNLLIGLTALFTTPSWLCRNVDDTFATSSIRSETFPEPSVGNCGKQAHVPPIFRWSLLECASMTDPRVVERSYESMRMIPREIYHDNFWKALPDTEETLVEVDLLVMWCDMSTDDCLWAANRTAVMYSAERKHGRCRKVEFITMNGNNHFAEFMAIVANILLP